MFIYHTKLENTAYPGDECV